MGTNNLANTKTVITELTGVEDNILAGLRGGWETRAYDLMEIMILDQYTNSVNLKTYMKAYLDELDILMEQTHLLYLGRMLEFAEGRQLDIIGEILQQSRSIIIDVPGEGWFGFQLAPDVLGFGNRAGDYPVGYSPGFFQGRGWYPWKFEPLSDIEYRGVLLARGYVCNNKTRDINTTYKAIELLLGKIPKYIKLIDLGTRQVTLELEAGWTTSKEVDLIKAVTKWFIPMGVFFEIVLI